MRRFVVVLGAGGVLAAAAEVSAQVPGLPVLQNAFSNPGLAFAANFGSGSGQSYYGAAGAWGLGATGRFLVSGAAGAQRSNNATRGAYGGRASFGVWNSAGGALGVAAFAGFGGAMRTQTAGLVTNPAVAIAPAGLSMGYRRALGTKRGISAYVSPFYRWVRSDSGSVASSGAFRVSGGLDFSINPSLGVTVGGEGGGSAANGRTSGAFGVGLTFVPGRRR